MATEEFEDAKIRQLAMPAEYVSEEIAEHRWNICKTCPELTKITHQCKLCGCFMILKTKLKKGSCPMGHWGQALS